MATTAVGGENFTAFDSRLKRICLSRPSSSRTCGSAGSSCERICTFASAAKPFITRSTAAMVSRRSNWSARSSIFPASILERSRMSLISSSRWLPAVWMFSRKRCRRGCSSPRVDVDEHAGEADDRVERRAQLVRHVGQELVLRAVGGDQAEVGLAQLVRPLHDPLLEGVGQPFQIAVEMGVLDRHRGLVGDGGEQDQVVGGEGVLLVALDRDDADDAVARDHRHAQPRLGRLRVGDGLDPEAPLFGGAAEEQRLVVLDDPGVEPFAEREALLRQDRAVAHVELERQLVRSTRRAGRC